MGRTLRRVTPVAAIAAALLAGGEPSSGAVTAGRIAYVQEKSEGIYALMTIRPDGTGVREVVRPRRGYPRPTLPRFSPDGRQMAFANIGGRPTLPGPLWLATPGGKRVREVPLDLDLDLARPFPTELSWAPDGHRLVMSEFRSSGVKHRMHVVSTDGSRRRSLGMGAHPVWSPDGRWIAFEAENGVWIVRPNGTDRRLLASVTDLDRVPGAALAFAPNGRRLLFTRPPLGGSGLEWWIVRLAGGEPRRIVTATSWCPPQWTPDGERLAAMRIDVDPQGDPTGDDGLRVFVTSRLDGSDERIEFVVPERYAGGDVCDFSWQRRVR